MLKSFVRLLQNTSIHLKTDNFATSVITKKGSDKTSLQEFPENINARNNNAAADAISNLTDNKDWQATVKCFQKISEIWGKFTVDRLANNENTKTEILSTGAQVHPM